MKRPLCLYHANCADGFCAAWVYHHHGHLIGTGPDCEFIAVNYGQDAPDVEGRDVVILDFSYPRQILLEMKALANSLLVLDHHKTAQAALADLDFCRFDMNKSGARMIWDYLQEKTADPHLSPWLVDYTEDRDLWLWKLPDSQAINSAIRSYPFTFDMWNTLANSDMTTLRNEGLAIQRAEREVIDRHVRHAQEVTIMGHKVLCVNATSYISEIAGELAKGRPFGVCWFETEKDERIYSLRSREGEGEVGLDVSEIAKKYGGGGHAHAAGFTVPATGGTGIFSRPKLGPEYEGDCRIAIAADNRNGLIRMEFGKPISFASMTREEATAFGNAILIKANQL